MQSRCKGCTRSAKILPTCDPQLPGLPLSMPGIGGEANRDCRPAFLDLMLACAAEVRASSHLLRKGVRQPKGCSSKGT